MIGRGSHDAMTHSLFPWMEKNMIHQINTIIDNPTPQQKKAHDMIRKSGMGFNPIEQNFGLWSRKNNHRQYNHNIWAGAQIAAQYGTQGYQAFLAHMTQDLMSDMMRDTFGYHGRNLIEAGIMYNMQGAKNINKRKNELNHFMPIPSMGMLPQNSRAQRKRFTRRVYPRFTRRY